MKITPEHENKELNGMHKSIQDVKTEFNKRKILKKSQTEIM